VHQDGGFTPAASDLGTRLSDLWARRYRALAIDEVELVEVTIGAFTYLFDLSLERAVGVYGFSVPQKSARPASRIRGHPLPADSRQRALIRGHLVAHSVGGGADINLIPQSAALNISGRWRSLERWSQTHPGSFLAVEVIYNDGTQTPSAFVYVATCEGTIKYEEFENR
jgi:hypothetical protein